MKLIFRMIIFLLLIIHGGEVSAIEIERQLDAALVEGIPLGGIGTGKVEVLPNGRLDRLTINNNPHRPITKAEGCFAAVRVSQENRRTAKFLHPEAVHAEAIESVTVEGFYPRARVHYQDAQLPVDIDLRVWNPHVPGEIERACYPVVVLEYEVRNRTEQAATVSLAQSWQNLIGLGGTLEYEYALAGECVHEPLRRGDLHGLRMGFNTSIMMDSQRNTLGEYGLFYERGEDERLSYLSSWDMSEFDQVWQRFRQEGGWERAATTERVETEGKERPAAALAATKEIPAQEQRTFRFYFVWHTPTRVDHSGKDYGNYYARRFNSPGDTVAEVSKRYEEIQEKWSGFYQRFARSSLTQDFVEHLFNGLSLLTTNGVFLEDETFSLLSYDETLAGKLGTPEERLTQMELLLGLYDELVYSELETFASCGLPNGEIPTTLGDVDTTLMKGESREGYLGRPVSSMAYLLYLYETYRQTGDSALLEEQYSSLQNMVFSLMEKDRNYDFIPEGSSFLPWGKERSISLYGGDLWLTALYVMDAIADQRGDLELQTRIQEYREEAEVHLQDQLWNGVHFNPYFYSNQPVELQSGNPFFALLPGTAFGLRKGWPLLLDENYLETHYRFLSEQVDSQEGISFSKSVVQQMVTAHTGTSLVRMGYPRAGMKWMQKAKPERRPLASAWSYLQALSGVSYDAVSRCFTVGPCPPVSEKDYTVPFFTPHYRGELELIQTRMNPVRICALRFDTVPRENELRIEEFGFLLPGVEQKSPYQMRVLHNETYLSGQDFTRDQQHVFGLTEPLQIKEGDQVTLLMAPTTGPKLTIDAKRRKIYNHGVKGTVENVKSNTSGFSFQIKNLLNHPQIINLELFNRGDNQYLVYLDGKNLTSAVIDVDRIPALLEPGTISIRDVERLEQIEWACGKAVVELATAQGADQIKPRLWDLQDQVKNALAMDAAMRGARIDVIPANAATSPPEVKRSPPSREAQEAVEETIDQAEEFYDNLDRLTVDPTLASNLAGYFVPLLFEVETSAIGQQTKSFDAHVTIRNPFRVPFRINRIYLEVPEGWRFESEDDLRIDARHSPPAEHSLRFFIQGKSDLWQERYSLEMAVSGTWNDHPFRRTIPFAAGHEFVKQWLVIGPFPNQQGEAFNEEYTPEVNIEPGKTYEGIESEVGWEEHTFSNGYVNYDKIFEPDDHAMAYAYTGIYSPRARTVHFEFGAHGDMKLFMNYKPIFAQRNVNSPEPSSKRLKVDLLQGWNHVVVKCGESTGPWGFYFEVADTDGRPLPDLRYAIDRVE